MTALYIHIPFCKNICPYCDFYKERWNSDHESRFVDAVIHEFDHYQIQQFNSLFLGGGTPSAMQPALLDRLLGHLRLDPKIEKTIEMNPESVSDDTLSVMQKHHINRISLGVQSFVPEELHFLGRTHTPQTIETSIEKIKSAGFKNFNLDFIYALPLMSLDSLEYSLSKAMSFEPTHVSTYSLSIEPGTPFHRRKVKKANSETDLTQSKFIRKFLKKNGFNHYEVSAYAKKGYECRHNLAYWRLLPYIGLGPSGASYYQNRFYQNKANIHDYIANPIPETPDNFGAMSDFLMTNLRLLDGFLLSDFSRRFQKDFLSEFAKPLKKLFDLKLLSHKNDRVKVTIKGLYLLDRILYELNV